MDMRESNENIKEFVVMARKKGYSNEKIVSFLLKKGYTCNKIDSVLSKKKNIFSGELKLIIIFILIVFITLSLYFIIHLEFQM